MTEYDYSPEALDAYNRTQQRIARWAEDTGAHSHHYTNPFAPRSESGSSDDNFYDRPSIPHRRSSSMGPPGAYNPTPAPNNYPPQPYSRTNLPGPLPGPMPAPQFGVQYVVSPPAMSNSHGSLYRSQSQDTLSHHSHHRHKSHRSSRHHSKSPTTYVIQHQTSPTYSPMVSPPLSTASNGTNIWYPQQAQAYATHQQATTPPQMLSPTHVPYVYPYSTAAPSAVQYPYGYVQQQAQPQTQYIVVQPSKSRKSSKSRKVYYL